jgi:hypothetical protein
VLTTANVAGTNGLTCLPILCPNINNVKGVKLDEFHLAHNSKTPGNFVMDGNVRTLENINNYVDA